MAKTIVITGCSSGFGRATALHLAQHGWHVFATLRKEPDIVDLQAEAAELGCAECLTPVLCDITRAGQVATLAETVAQTTPRLDALLNNAGAVFAAPLELLALDDLRAQMETNLIGHIAITQALLPLLKAGRGIIINVTSVAGHIVFPVIGAYAASKSALEAVSDTLRIELAPFGVRVATVTPHGGATAIWETARRRATALSQASQENPYKPLMLSVERFFKQTVSKGYPPEFFANKVRKILSVARPRARYAISAQAGLLIFLRGWLPNGIWDWMLRQTLRW